MVIWAVLEVSGVDSVTAYAKQVIAGKIVAGKSVVLACKRHLRDLKRSKKKDYPYYFDVEAAEHCFQFAELYCRHSKGEWAGQPLELEEWQKFCVGNIFGWKRKDDGLRKYQYFYIQVARKNGKSTLMAFIGLYVLVCDGEAGAEIYSAATKKDQAKIIFDEAKNMVNASPELRKLLTVYKNNISFDTMLSKFEPLASDSNSLDGLNVHLGLIDELHAHKNSSVYDVIDSAKGAREQPLIGAGTTAGNNPQCFCKSRYDFYKNILNETVENEDIFIYIAELDTDDDWTDESVWIKANPNLNVSVNLRDMRNMCETAKSLVSAQNEFKCKKLNMWVSSAISWANMQSWKECPQPFPKESLLGKRCYVGGDLAMRNDLASITQEFPLEDGYYAVLSHSFMPEDRIYENSRRDNVDYQAWIDAGYITPTPGSVVDFDYIEEYIKRQAELYDIVEVCFDPWNATQLMSHLIDDGFRVVETRMGYRTLSEPTKDLEGAILNHKIIHFNDPLLTWAVGNVVVQSDENANVRPVKTKSGNKIDPAMAFIISHTRAYVDSENYIDINQTVADELAQFAEMLGV